MLLVMSDADLRPRVPRREWVKKVQTNEEAFLKALADNGCTNEEDREVLLGMPRRSVNRYIYGEVVPKLDTARRIADRLGKNVDELWPAA